VIDTYKVRYSVDSRSQTVLRIGAKGGISAEKACVVFDKFNWKCSSGEMKEGVFIPGEAEKRIFPRTYNNGQSMDIELTCSKWKTLWWMKKNFPEGNFGL